MISGRLEGTLHLSRQHRERLPDRGVAAFKSSPVAVTLWRSRRAFFGTGAAPRSSRVALRIVRRSIDDVVARIVVADHRDSVTRNDGDPFLRP